MIRIRGFDQWYRKFSGARRGEGHQRNDRQHCAVFCKIVNSHHKD